MMADRMTTLRGASRFLCELFSQHFELYRQCFPIIWQCWLVAKVGVRHFSADDSWLPSASQCFFSTVASFCFPMPPIGSDDRACLSSGFQLPSIVESGCRLCILHTHTPSHCRSVARILLCSPSFYPTGPVLYRRP